MPIGRQTSPEPEIVEGLTSGAMITAADIGSGLEPLTALTLLLPKENVDAKQPYLQERISGNHFNPKVKIRNKKEFTLTWVTCGGSLPSRVRRRLCSGICPKLLSVRFYPPLR